MSELVTKYRPALFKEVVGQEDVVRSMRRIIKQRKSRAFLLTGPSGTGKTTLARIAAKAFGVEERGMVEVDAATNTGVDAMRAIKQPLQFKFGTGGRAIIVDECHSLSTQAWQSLLKDVEEPPPGVHWFFCTTEAGKVPRTIKTRCTCYDLKAVAEDKLFGLLQHVVSEEALETPEEVLDLVAQQADGSPREALSMLAVVSACTERKQAAVMLQSAIETPEVIDLCRLLLKGTTWERALKVVNKGGLLDVESEGVRQVILAYFTKVAKDSSAKQAGKVLAILDAFGTPCPPRSKGYPLLLSLGDLLLDE